MRLMWSHVAAVAEDGSARRRSKRPAPRAGSSSTRLSRCTCGQTRQPPRRRKPSSSRRPQADWSRMSLIILAHIGHRLGRIKRVGHLDVLISDRTNSSIQGECGAGARCVVRGSRDPASCGSVGCWGLGLVPRGAPRAGTAARDTRAESRAPRGISSRNGHNRTQT